VLDSGLVIIYLTILFWQSPIFGGVVLGLGLVQVGLLFVTRGKLHELTQQDLSAQSRTQSYLTEVLTGIALVKASGAEQSVLKHWTNLFNAQLNLSVRRNYLLALVETVLLGMRNLPLLILLGVGTLQVLQAEMTMGTMLALNSLAVSCLLPLNNLVNSGQRLQLVRSHFERIADVLAVAPEQADKGLVIPARLSGQVEVRNVDFRYSPNAPLVLQNINLTVQPGQKVALVGQSGSGKSTLARLLLGLYQPVAGEIRLDGQPLHRFDYRAVRHQFGVVLQEVGIFSGSIRDNIAFHEPELALEQVITAAKANCQWAMRRWFLRVVVRFQEDNASDWHSLGL
jgi:ATP-binding cassette, subfamily B, bacterial